MQDTYHALSETLFLSTDNGRTHHRHRSKRYTDHHQFCLHISANVISIQSSEPRFHGAAGAGAGAAGNHLRNRNSRRFYSF